MEYLLLLLGFVLLIKGADFFVDGAVSVATRFRIPSVIVGLTIVALGTSLPEFSVSLSAALAGSNSLALSNVVGSNIFNTLVVVGCSAAIAPFVISKDVISRDLLMNVGVSVLLFIMALSGELSRLNGTILLCVLVVYLAGLIIAARRDKVHEDAAEEEKILRPWICVLYLALGFLGIYFGGELVVDNARLIALELGMSETLVGLTIVSLGTSLPELVTSVVAARKGESGLSLGNAIGSNIMNICFILGFSSAIHPIAILAENRTDMLVLIAISLFIWAMARLKDRLSRWQGFLMLGVYAVYLAYIIMR